MNKKNIVEIVIRIYALYLLVMIPMSIWGIISVFSMDNSQFIKNPALYKFSSIVYPFLYFIISMFLLSKAENIAQFIVGRGESKTKSTEKTLPYTQLSFWITLLGLYFFITSISTLISELIRMSSFLDDSFIWSIIISKGIVIIIACYMTFSSQKVESLILKLQGK